ncbi:Putative S-adenosyl-L-methionine-dependent methyltransferase [Methyloversatilis universalis FAM5]|uniref:S-adenosyl-L-methionine-dependent methyltransferase n=1 Tax=Methyloversatilis universalis (strain ATCC BAA-1314 / DSM 25237 / JCM 13912 / CCUG 52030 / FAM5) TaxID=1000565 RepID=F5R8V0_METUF|nr:class I SAM-dependent methyltransferase [Methyloversatilis universalis]EGK72840.1 Putative S-adenosyl-L-methionine-dependent methyltransferase [Methyloversatilis universalis FAM5]
MSFADAQDFWSDRYRAAGEAYLFGTAPNRYLAAQAALLAPGMRALSVADGEGRNAVWLAEQGLDVTATELSPVAIEKAEALAASRGVKVDFALADALNWIYPDDAFDLVVAVFIQFAAPDERAALFERLQRTLRPGGRIVLQGYTPKQLEYRTGGPSAVENLYTAALLREAFAGLEIERLDEYEDELDEGSAHCGRSAVIGMVARKPA